MHQPSTIFNHQRMKNSWGIWLSYSSNKRVEPNYSGSLLLVHEFTQWAQFLQIWKQSPISDPANFFVNPRSGTFVFEDELRKIDSINFFRDSIQPTWEYGQNSNGGYYNFCIAKDCNRIQEVYQSVVFLALGGKAKICNRLNGIRIVDTALKSNNMMQCRLQLWVDFKEHDETQLKKYWQQLETFFHEQSIPVYQNRLKFFDIIPCNKETV